MGKLTVRRLLTSLVIAATVFAAAPAFSMQVVPPGTCNVEQPDVPGASVRRTKGTKDHLRPQVREGPASFSPPIAN